MAEAKANTFPIYGHISGTLTVSQCSSETKKMKLERPSLEEIEGCVIIIKVNNTRHGLYLDHS